jgi:hypothetical protein
MQRWWTLREWEDAAAADLEEMGGCSGDGRRGSRVWEVATGARGKLSCLARRGGQRGLRVGEGLGRERGWRLPAREWQLWSGLGAE